MAYGLGFSGLGFGVLGFRVSKVVSSCTTPTHPNPTAPSPPPSLLKMARVMAYGRKALGGFVSLNFV